MMDYEIGGDGKRKEDWINYELESQEALRRRMGDFGLVPGTQVVARFRSPGGGVMALECRGTVLAMRTRDLKGVRVKWG